MESGTTLWPPLAFLAGVDNQSTCIQVCTEVSLAKQSKTDCDIMHAHVMKYR